MRTPRSSCTARHSACRTPMAPRCWKASSTWLSWRLRGGRPTRHRARERWLRSLDPPVPPNTMPINPLRLRLRDTLDTLPQAMPMPVALERTHTREALSTIEHLAIEMSLQTHSLCLVHSTVPELQANAILECALGPASDARGSAVFQRLLGFNFREAPRQCASL